MKIVSLASGSKGNCTLVQSDEAIILIDIGISLKEIEHKFNQLNLDTSKVDAIFLTHEHSDHTKGLCSFCKKNNTKIYVRKEALKFFTQKIDVTFDLSLFNTFDLNFSIKDLQISSFQLPHDSNFCVGYSIQNKNNKFAIATDLGHITNEIYLNIKDSALVFLEANHDEKLLINNPNYPAHLKKRILSNVGHLSNATSAKIIEQLCFDGTQQVVLSHLSEQNNSPSLAYNTIKNYLAQHNIIEGKNIFIDVNTQFSIGTIFNLK